eukprot:12498667-Prorocentrum_lima.AAC.1
MTSSLVGSEMCIRDRGSFAASPFRRLLVFFAKYVGHCTEPPSTQAMILTCLLYTSDAADDM